MFSGNSNAEKVKIMSLLNSIGLDIQKSEELAQKLNELLANYSIFYQNTRGSH
ncbi:MAG: hypothetical protein NVS9B7_27650 [Flavisolibacter sp.]